LQFAGCSQLKRSTKHQRILPKARIAGLLLYAARERTNAQSQTYWVAVCSLSGCIKFALQGCIKFALQGCNLGFACNPTLETQGITMGISIRAYARMRGVSDTSIHKAIKAGRITPEADGSIDADRANQQWSENTDQSQQRKPPTKVSKTAQVATVAPPQAQSPPNSAPQPAPQVSVTPRSAPADSEASLGVSGSATFVQARTANEVIKAQTNKVKLSRMKGELIERKRAEDMVFQLAREERDALQNWPARVSAEMAAELGVDPHRLHTLLEREIRNYLLERGNPQPRL
jgi:hypothetical protein